MLSDSTTLTLLRRHHLFDKLPEGTFQEVCGLAHLRRLETGDSVFHQGNTADRFYVLQNGQIKLTWRLALEPAQSAARVSSPTNHTLDLSDPVMNPQRTPAPPKSSDPSRFDGLGCFTIFFLAAQSEILRHGRSEAPFR